MNTASYIDETKIDVMLEMEAPPDDVDAVKRVFQKEGIGCTFNGKFIRLSAGELPWVIFLCAPLGVFFTAFLKSAGQEAGRDAYLALRRLVSRLYAARRKNDGSIAIIGSENYTQIDLREDLPEEAYRQLAEMGPHELDGGNWIWDFKQNHWIDQNEWMRKR